MLGASNEAIKFSDVLYVPSLSTNLLSVEKIANKQIINNMMMLRKYT